MYFVLVRSSGPSCELGSWSYARLQIRHSLT